eukprot:TRINITY_DN325_c0_g1_i3.p1 TRINITY_DN325_c0_g1~~TRINITY_DN325_c0_g1_i3.p1  ORF type:complete len:296 (+),score=38.22 TRINITY_DN325_c0_g1_i3:66-953(+)
MCIRDSPHDMFGQVYHYLDVQNSRLDKSNKLTFIEKFHQTNWSQLISQTEAELNEQDQELQQALAQQNKEIQNRQQLTGREIEQQSDAELQESNLQQDKDYNPLNLALSSEEWGPDNKKQIFLASPTPADSRAHLWRTYSIALGGTWAYLLWAGSASYSTLLALPLLAIYSFNRYWQTYLDHLVPKVVSIEISKENQQLDFIIQSGQNFLEINDVKQQDLKVLSNSRQLLQHLNGGAKGKNTFPASFIKELERNQNYRYITIADQLVALPFEFQADNLQLAEIIRNRSIETTELV